jgi:hypothetical protein
MRPTAAAVEDIPHPGEVSSWVACAKRIGVGDAAERAASVRIVCSEHVIFSATSGRNLVHIASEGA